MNRLMSVLLALIAALCLAAPARADWATATVAAGTQPYAVAVNPVTNKIYVANISSANVTVIDCTTNGTTTVAAGTQTYAVAVNPVTNKIYVANAGSANVTVIDGATNGATTVTAGTQPCAVAVNPVTNKIYVANNGSANVTVIDGATNGTTTVAAGTEPLAVAVNPATNKIYIANLGSGNMTVIDGATNDTTTVAAGTQPCAVAVNPVTNKIYVANYNSANVTVIDGATNGTTTVAAGTYPRAVALNPVTNKVYAANVGSNNVTVIDEVPANDTGVLVEIDSLPYNMAYQSSPVLTGKGVNRWTTNKTKMMGVMNNWMTGQQKWNWAAGPFDSLSTDSIGWTYNWGSDSLVWGENYVSIVPLEMQAATTNNLGLGTPFAGNMLTYPIYRVDSTAYGVEGKPAEDRAHNIFKLGRNWPNPMRDQTTFCYQLPKTSQVRLDIYNLAGQKVQTLFQGIRTTGYHTEKWNADRMASGVYFYRLQAGSFTASGKVILLR